MTIKSVKVTASSASYGADPLFDAGFPGQMSLVLVGDVASDVTVSFDGTQDDVILVPEDAPMFVTSAFRYQRVWARISTGSAVLLISCERAA